MICLICNKKIDRGCETKITCVDCKVFYHCSCVNINSSDLEYMNTHNVPYRCHKCSALRRKSLQQQSASVPSESTAVAAASTTKQRQKRNQPITAPLQTATELTDERNATAAYDLPQQSDEGAVTLQMLYKEIICLKNINCDFLSKINQLKEENEKLISRVTSLESRLNWREQKNVENVIEITGVPGVNNSNAAECVQTIFSNALDVSVSSSDIQKCYVKRVWKKKQ